MSSHLLTSLKDKLQPHGLEVDLFKMQWYNEKVEERFRLNYPGDTVCANVLSGPSFFEKAVIPFLHKEAQLQELGLSEAENRCASKIIKEAVANLDIDTADANIMFANEMIAERTPKVLVQYAGHVAGAAFYYQRRHVMYSGDAPNDGPSESDPWGPDENIYGVSIHPKYGGYFLFRAVIVFPSLQDPELPYRPPPDVVPDREKRIELLNRANSNGPWRDIIPVEEKYSENRKRYSQSSREDRKKVVEEIYRSLYPNNSE